ncbi:TPA: hypothetical protein TXL68_001947 [Streptococcus suis]|uniref:YopX protein domain-containing protein n=3 Tax=Streptococcus suis TaxID=1307 RepID=A0A426T937_STRSU|nr:YopX family protein [Streptococcus suis]RRR50364.1 hypothetical protein EJA00_00005 [Streptococcus suis]HEL1643071.1 hypothetical protein [Streptococcus suis]
MIPKFRAWDKIRNRISEVERIYIDTKGVRLRDENGEYWRRFDDVILMQSTGVFDKNGKEIFEGDVVNIFGEKLSKIYYSDGAFCVDILIGGTPLHAFLSEQLEIIGNIHRNPELMEEVLND